MENQSLIRWISVYLKLGWSMFPVRAKSKEPLMPWKEYQTRKAREQEIHEWLKKWPQMNLGLVTGQVSGLVVVDLDGINGMQYSSVNHLLSPVICVTWKGKQLYYKWTEHVDNSASKIAPGVDIRGDGGFVVLPPSQHPNGKYYRWERFVPENISLFPADQFFIVLKTVQNPLFQDVLKIKESDWIAKALEEMKIGNIDTTLTSILGRLRHDGYTAQDSLQLLLPHAKMAGAISGHLEEKIKNILK